MRFCRALIALVPFPALAQTFEVASIRLHPDDQVFGQATTSSPLVRLSGYTIFGLVMDAYGLHDYQLSFGNVAPKDDVYNTRYDIAARAPFDRAPNPAELRAMLQALLADRFKFNAHRDSREMPVYTLVAAKNGAKLTPGSGDSECQMHSRLAPDGRNNEETFSHCPVDRLAERLTRLVEDRLVLDQTGLTGNYDFQLTAIPESRTRTGSDPIDIPLPTALAHLGLRLQAQKAQIGILVVDRVEKPSEN